MTDQADKSMGLVLKPLRQALKQKGITEEYIIDEMKKILDGENMSAKMRALELLSRWASWNAPDKHIVKHESITIGNAPEDLDV